MGDHGEGFGNQTHYEGISRKFVNIHLSFGKVLMDNKSYSIISMGPALQGLGVHIDERKHPGKLHLKDFLKVWMKLSKLKSELLFNFYIDWTIKATPLKAEDHHRKGKDLPVDKNEERKIQEVAGKAFQILDVESY